MNWLATTLLCLLLACSPNWKWQAMSIDENWYQVRVENSFILSLPSELSPDNSLAVDSLFGQFSNDGALLYYDFGKFSDPLTSYKEEKTYREESLSINGKRAKIITAIDTDGDENFPHVAAIHFSNLRGENRLTVHLRCTTQKVCQEYGEIFYLIQFL